IPPRMPASFIAGTSNIVMFGTRYGVCGTTNCAWSDIGANTLFGTGYPQFGVAQEDCTVRAVNGFTTEAVHICMGDGHVQSVRPGVDASTWALILDSSRSTHVHSHPME